MKDAESEETKTGRILVVEDEPGIARLIQVNLEREGYQVEIVDNGLEALKKIQERRPDLLITDILMPEMNGLELVASLWRDPDLAELPVIILSIKSQEEDLLQAFELGASVYLIKPFDPRELVALARRLLG